MKKILVAILAATTISATAINLQMVYVGPWESTVQYNPKPIPYSSQKIGQVVSESGSSYITNGTSSTPQGVRPESAAGWTKLGLNDQAATEKLS